MKTIRVEVAVDADDDVTPEMVADMVKLQLWFLFGETNKGLIYWRDRLAVRPLYGGGV